MMYRRPSAEQLPPLDTPTSGLTTAQVEAQRNAFGSNDIVPQASSSWWSIARDTVRDPMLWFLAFTAFVGVNLLQSGLTQWCLLETLLRKVGIQPGC